MQKKVLSRVDVFTSDTTLTDQTYSGWKAINTGLANASVLGVELAPGETLDFLDISNPDVVWESPIPIKASGSQITLIRLIYK